ncbi:MAG: DUF1697 domain-containing protein [Streptosporangiaceae bacterium]
MPSHVALLRGVNVRGVKLAMSDLREVLSSLGYADVSTYIQSGNALFSTDRAGPAELGAEIEAALDKRLGLRPRVLVLTRDELAQVLRDNPYPDEANPRAVHAVFLAEEPGPDQVAALAAAQQKAADKGSRDTARCVGRVLFLHTPDGFGRSELAVQLSRGGGPMSAKGAGTARNWATVTKLLSLCGA